MTSFLSNKTTDLLKKEKDEEIQFKTEAIDHSYEQGQTVTSQEEGNMNVVVQLDDFMKCSVEIERCEVTNAFNHHDFQGITATVMPEIKIEPEEILQEVYLNNDSNNTNNHQLSMLTDEELRVIEQDYAEENNQIELSDMFDLI